MARNAEDFEERPWGTFEVIHEFELDEVEVVVKKIVVQPGKRLSYQSHELRREHWYIVSGEGLVTLDDQPQDVAEGDSIDVEIGMKHRIENTGQYELIFIEVSSGKFDEFDNTRYEDDFGRAEAV